MADTTTIKVKGFTFTVKHEHDDTGETPWDRDESSGIVTDWINTSRLDDDQDRDDYHNKDLYRALSFDHGSTRFYDMRATLEKAEEQQWGLADEPRAKLAATLGHEPTEEEVRQAAVEQDYQFIRGWCNDEWWYVGVIVTLQGTDYERSLWGVESCSTDYLQEVATQLAEELIHALPQELDRSIAVLQAIRAQLLELKL